MIGFVYHSIGLAINFYILVAVYYYSVKKYGIKVTIITNLSLSSFILVLILLGAYSAADLELAPYNTLIIGETEFWATDPITVYTVFMILFELARYSFKNSRRENLTFKKIVSISIVVTIYGITFQFLIDPTAAALGLYSYQNPPIINIFGFPIWFITAFGIYGLYAFIFLLFERLIYQRNLIQKEVK